MRDLQREFDLPEVIRLEQNYRSHGNILDAANALIKQNRGRLGKNLWTEAGAGEPIRVFEGYSDIAEAAFIVEEICELAGDGVSRQQMALLYRSNAQSRVLEHQLFKQGLPIAFMAACASSIARRSSTRSLICGCWPIPTTIRLSPGWSISRRAGSAGAASRRCRRLPGRPTPACITLPPVWPASPAARWPGSSPDREPARRDPGAAFAGSDRPAHRAQRPAPALSCRQGRPGSTREPRRVDQRREQFPERRRRAAGDGDEVVPMAVRWRPFSRTPRSKRASTRPARGRTPSS
jgi:hypothetical protein